MRYTEKQINDTVNNPIEVVKFGVVHFLSAPIRLFSEMGKRVIFLGEYTYKFLLGVIILNTILIIMSAVQSIVFTKVFVIVKGFMPLIALLISLGLNIVIFLLFSKLRYPIDINNSDIADKVEALDKINEAHKDNYETKESEKLKEIDLNLDLLSDLPSETEKDVLGGVPLTEKLEVGDLDLDDEDIFDLVNSLPDKSVDHVYNYNKDERVDSMLDILKGKNAGRDNVVDSEYFEQQLTDEEGLKELAKEINFHPTEIAFSKEEEEEIMYEVHREVVKNAPQGFDGIDLADDFLN